MKARKKKSSKPTLSSMTAEYKKRGMKRPKAMAAQYRAGFKAGKRSMVLASRISDIRGNLHAVVTLNSLELLL